MGICARGQINRFYSASLCAELYEAVTGIKTDIEDLRKRVDRVWTLLKIANLREGRGKGDEALPEKWFSDPPFRDYLTGEPLSKEDVQQMIEDYYDEWGWDPKTGIPTQRLLDELGLASR
jgi:aldehyde:ferredoxin oxidoreductase